MPSPQFVISYLKLKKRKGLDKPVFIVASLALALMFLALYFSSVSGWLDNAVSQFTEGVNQAS
jgi:hypothetical protein